MNRQEDTICKVRQGNPASISFCKLLVMTRACSGLLILFGRGVVLLCCLCFQFKASGLSLFPFAVSLALALFMPFLDVYHFASLF
jgi:hypothetical protein